MKKDNRDALRQQNPRKTVLAEVDAEFLRAQNEDDDGYDPYSDRPARPEPLFEEDPWA